MTVLIGRQFYHGCVARKYEAYGIRAARPRLKGELRYDYEDGQQRVVQCQPSLQSHSGSGWASGDGEHEFAGGFAAFEVAMGIGGLCQRIGAVDAQLELARIDPAQHVARAP